MNHEEREDHWSIFFSELQNKQFPWMKNIPTVFKDGYACVRLNEKIHIMHRLNNRFMRIEHNGTRRMFGEEETENTIDTFAYTNVDHAVCWCVRLYNMNENKFTSSIYSFFHDLFFQ